MESGESLIRENAATPMFYDADLENFEHEDEPLKVSPYMLKSFQFVKDKTTGYYGCQFCSYRSMHRSSIKSHLAVHSSARPFACGMCEYEAKRLNDLRKHWLIKHGKRLATRSRGYRPRISPNSSLPTGPSSEVNLIGDYSGAGSGSMRRDTSHSPCGNEHINDGESSAKWMDSSNQLSTMPVYPEPEICLENATASSPHSELNDVDLDLLDAEDDDANHSDIFPRSDADDLVVVKPEPPQDEFYSHVRKDGDANKEENSDAVADSCTKQENSQHCKSKEIMSEKETDLSPSPGPSSLRDSNKPSNALLRNSHSPNTSEFNTSHSSLHKHQSSSISMLQTKNLSGASMMAQTYSSEPRSARRFNNSESVSVSDVKCSTRNRLQYTWTSDSSNSTTVTSTALNLRHANVGTNRGWMCAFCNIQFFDNAIYFMHMGLHDKRDPWKCTVCGKRLYDVYSFTSHFVNGHASS